MQLVRLTFYAVASVSPGSHIWGDKFADSVQEATGSSIEGTFGLAPGLLPSVAIESQPGDVVVFIQTCKHAAFGGNSRRRMFTINCTLPYNGVEEEKVLRREIKNIHAASYRKDVYEGAMLETATPQRMVHLAALVKQREYFIAECKRKLLSGEASGLGAVRKT